MATSSKQAETTNDRTDAFGRDKLYGQRLDTAFAMGEEFLLLGVKVTGELIETKFGEAPVVRMLCQKLDTTTGAPVGQPSEYSSVASSIVEKLSLITAEELAAGPIVKIEQVEAERSGTGKATVITFVRNLKDGEDVYAKYGLDAGDVARLTDQARPAGERMPEGY